MKLAAVETNDRFLGCGAECLSAELRRLFCCTSERADFNPAALGSVPPFRTVSSNDRFKTTNVSVSIYQADMTGTLLPLE